MHSDVTDSPDTLFALAAGSPQTAAIDGISAAGAGLAETIPCGTTTAVDSRV